MKFDFPGAPIKKQPPGGPLKFTFNLSIKNPLGTRP